jgi:CheY-like chemotaxis protein
VLADGLWPVLVDPGQFEQVLLNLAVNARDAMPRGGVLRIETRNVVIDEHRASGQPMLHEGAHVELTVSDTGVGMERAVLERIFEPFFTTKPKGEGSGLGLATVYGIVSQAGGFVSAYSEPGRGTSFKALFPVTEPVPLAGEEATAPVNRRGGEVVLVVEDEEAMREVTRRLLMRNGHEVLTARNGPEAIGIARDHAGTIDLLLTDVVMPQMLGKEVAERVHEIRPSIRVLYMSGYAQPVLASQGTLEEGVILVEKPFTEAALIAKVREVLDKQLEAALA